MPCRPMPLPVQLRLCRRSLDAGRLLLHPGAVRAAAGLQRAAAVLVGAHARLEEIRLRTPLSTSRLEGGSLRAGARVFPINGEIGRESEREIANTVADVYLNVEIEICRRGTGSPAPRRSASPRRRRSRPPPLPPGLSNAEASESQSLVRRRSDVARC